MNAALHSALSTVRRVEDGATIAALLAMSVLPVIDIVLRGGFGFGIPGSASYVQHLTLWVGFLGAMIAAREGSHLSLSLDKLGFSPALRKLGGPIAALVSTAVATGLFWGSLMFVNVERDAPMMLGGWLPVWIAEIILPIAFVFVVGHLVARATGPNERIFALAGIALFLLVGIPLEPYAALLVWPAIAGLIIAAALGAPIFVVIGGAALLLFFADAVPIAAIPVEAYRIVVSPTIPTIPLFTLAGFILAEGGASERLVRLFRALFGWAPGGQFVATTLVCAFFTTFTGASGVTILALGGLLLPVLIKSGFSERFSLGAITATGSIGLLFPPSLALILYGVVAHVPIPELFVAGIVPGLILVGAVCLFGIIVALRSRAGAASFDPREAVLAAWDSKWEILLPAVVLVGIFGGFATLVEAAAATVVYTLIVEIAIHRNTKLAHDMPSIIVKCSAMVGGIFIILGVAMGLTNYLIDAQVPMKAAAWVEANVESRIVFLIALNIFLLIVGCLMDIFSAIVVVVPLILPIARVFGIDPLHLAMIFLINLELGYLTPPVGLNLFLASFRFDKPLTEVYRASLPFFLVMLGVVLLITYFPGLIIGVN